MSNASIQSPVKDRRELLSIVIPMMNEEASVDELMRRVFEALKDLPVRAEIICVDDGSRDRTWEKIVQWREANPVVKAVALSRNFGKEIALTAGLDLASGDAAVLLDGDLQHPPEVIPAMFARWREGNDVVYAVRRDRTADGALRRLLSKAFYRVFNALSQTPIVHDAGDFRLMDRKVFEAVRRLRERMRFMKGIYSWVGFRSVSVEYDVPPRAHGRSSFSIRRLFTLAFDGILSFSTLPLGIAVFFGAMIALSSLVSGIYFLVKTLIFGIDVPGYASLIVALLGLSGLMLLQMGLIGIYIGRIYHEVKDRPLYVVRQTLGAEPADGGA